MDIVEEVKEYFKGRYLNFEEKNVRRYYIDINSNDILSFIEVIFKVHKCRFSIATGLETPEQLEILYHFSHDVTGNIFTVRAIIKDKVNPKIESITGIVKGAEWIEREIHELLGIDFLNHPNLKPLVLPDDWPKGNYPLRSIMKKESK